MKAREKGLDTNQGASTRQTADFSSAAMETGRQWNELFKVLKERLWMKATRSSKAILQQQKKGSHCLIGADRVYFWGENNVLDLDRGGSYTTV